MNNNPIKRLLVDFFPLAIIRLKKNKINCLMNPNRYTYIIIPGVYICSYTNIKMICAWTVKDKNIKTVKIIIKVKLRREFSVL